MKNRKLTAKLISFCILAVIALSTMFHGEQGPAVPSTAEAPQISLIGPETAAASEAPAVQNASGTDAAQQGVREDGTYVSKDEVALYLHLYGHLPSNYVTKKEAEAAGWDNAKGNLPLVLPGKSIGGDRFVNYEKELPKKKGRKYYECDIDFDTDGKPGKERRGSKRIVWSDDGLIYYSPDHYASFELLYGEP